MEEKNGSWLVPVAIIICILLIGGAVYFKDKTGSNNGNNASSTGAIPTELSQLLKPAENIDLAKLRPIDGTDKLRGQASAPIKIIVYTDLECPAWKYFHDQLKTIEAKYVTSGQVAISYRDLPLDQIHPKSRTEFLAAECVKEVGGLDKYWQFIDKIFEITPSNNGLEIAKLGETAKALGVETNSFNTCVSSKKFAANIEKSVQEATALGIQGTPFFVVITKDQTIPVYGAAPSEALSAAFDIILGTNKAPTPEAAAPTNGIVAGTSTTVTQ